MCIRDRAEADALAHPLVDVVVHPWIAMAQDDRAVAHPKLDVLVPVQVPYPAAFAPIDVDRVFPPRAEVRVRAAGQGLQGAAVHGELALALEDGGRAGDGF